MRSTYVSLSALLVAVSFVSAGNGLLSVFLAVRMTAEHFSTGLTGLVVTGYSIGFVGGSLVIAGVVRRVGHVRTLVACAALMALACLAFPLSISGPAWLALRVITGIGAAGVFIVAESWLAGKSPAELRGRIFGVYMISQKMTYGGGQLLLIAGDPLGVVFFMASAALYVTCLLPISLTTAESPPLPERTGFNLRRIYHVSPLAVVASLCAGMVNSAMVTLGPLYGAGLNFDIKEISFFAASIQFGSLVLQYPIGKLSDIHDRRLVLIGVCIVSAALAATAALFGHLSFWMLVGISLAYGGISFAVYPIAVAHAADHAEPGQLIVVSSGMLALWGVGSVVGPLIATQMMSLLGPPGLFWFAAGMCLLLALYTTWRVRRRAPPARIALFIAMPPTPAAPALDPRPPR